MQPKVSVCVITYNHAKFIKQALEGIIMQQCNFDFEVVIGDDLSTDATVAIAREYAEKYPDKIKLNNYADNVGMVENWKRCILACTGEYIALIEGDDYWTSPLKLQKEVDILDRDKNLSFCCHDVDTLHEPGVPHWDTIYHIGQTNTFTLSDILSKPGFIPTCSILFRRSVLPTIPSWVDNDLKCVDLPVELLLASRGPFFYINEKMGVYRLHVGGISHATWVIRKNMLQYDHVEILNRFNKHTGFMFNEEVTNWIERLYKAILNQNGPKSKAYAKAMIKLLLIRPRKNIDLFKGWIINQFIPKNIYFAYNKIFK